MHPGTQKPYTPAMVRMFHKKITEKAGLEHAVKLIEQVDSKVLGAVYMGEMDSANYGYYYQ